jgi:hypothetical protein
MRSVDVGEDQVDVGLRPGGEASQRACHLAGRSDHDDLASSITHVIGSVPGEQFRPNPRNHVVLSEGDA